MDINDNPQHNNNNMHDELLPEIKLIRPGYRVKTTLPTSEERVWVLVKEIDDDTIGGSIYNHPTKHGEHITVQRDQIEVVVAMQHGKVLWASGKCDEGETPDFAELIRDPLMAAGVDVSGGIEIRMLDEDSGIPDFDVA